MLIRIFVEGGLVQDIERYDSVFNGEVHTQVIDFDVDENDIEMKYQGRLAFVSSTSELHSQPYRAIGLSLKEKKEG